MQDLLSGRIKLSEVFVNKLVRELTSDTECSGLFTIVLAGEDTVKIRFTKPMYSVKEVALHLEKVRHDCNTTQIQLRIGEVTAESLFVKPLVNMLKSRFTSWMVQIAGTIFLPKGIHTVVKADQIVIEMRQWLRKTAVGELQLPVIGNLLEATRVLSAQISHGEIIIDTSVEDGL